MFSSKNQRRRNTDQQPYVLKYGIAAGMHVDSTSAFLGGFELYDYAPRPEYNYGTLPTNVIIDVIRDSWDSGAAHHCATEALFQLARHWAQWQSPRIGTFPLSYRDPSGPTSRELSEETGEDYLYWWIEDAINQYLTEGADGYHVSAWRVQDMIVHAVKVFDKIYELTKEES